MITNRVSGRLSYFRSLMKLRIGVVQFSPKIGQIQANITRIQELCAKIQPGSLDMLCFPEMALTGYAFKDATSIQPYLEKSRIGHTSLFCSKIAKKLHCYVFAGYPEELSPVELDTASSDQVGANSAVVYGPEGEWIGGYRKTNLFRTDKTWAKPGTGFKNFQLPPPFGNVCVGICMDLNPHTEDSTKFELANHCLSTNVNVLVLLNAWLDSEENLENPYDSSTVQYWAALLEPLWTNQNGSDSDIPSPTSTTNGFNSLESEKGTIVVVCNRSGEENGNLFAGTSAIFRMKSRTGHPKLLDMLERDEEAARIWDIQV